MSLLSRRQTLGGLAALGGLGLLPQGGAAAPAERLDNLTINAMPATPSVVLAHLAESGVLAPHAARTVVKVWRTPDQLRAGILAGEMKVFGIPSHTAANLANRGVPLRMVDVLTWGLLYVMSRDPAVTRIEDLAGRQVLMAFRHDAPDLIFRLVLRRAGMDPDKDVKLQYQGTPTETAQLFLAGKGDMAVIPEPAATAARLRGMQSGIAIHRALDLTEVYGRLAGRPPRLPQAGLAVSEDLVQSRPELVKALHEGCRASAGWVLNNPASAGRLGSDYLDLPPPVIEASLPHFRMAVVPAAEARPEMEAYFADLLAMSPEVIGGKLPEGRFYWGA
jgi:NitT/TauT family transport system substrate-binding protein